MDGEVTLATEPAETNPGDAFLMAAFDPANRADPYPLYHRMRDEAPVLDSGIGLWFCFTHAGAHRLLRAKGLSSDERTSTEFNANLATDPRLQKFAEQEPLMLFTDPPDHTRLRSLVVSAFTPRTVEKLVPRIQANTDALLDQLADTNGEPVDLLANFARPLPVNIICEMLGVPEGDVDLFSEWSDGLTIGIDPGILRSAEDEARVDVARAELADYTAELLAERRKTPQDDLISALLAARDGEDRLTESELIQLVILLLVAGHETTVNLIGNGLTALLANQDELAKWRADPSLDANAVDEILRFDSPVQIGMRVATEPFELEGVEIPKGDQVTCLLGAANRDPSVFTDPDRLDLSRENANRHLSFGGGIHHCLGMALARIEGQIALGGIIRRFGTIESAAPIEVRPRFVLRGREAVMASVKA